MKARLQQLAALLWVVGCVQAQAQQGSPCSPVCQNSGQCQQQFNSEGYSCNCTGTGFAGLDCLQPETAANNSASAPAASQSSACSPVCQNSGKCQQQFNSEGYSCNCAGTGFVGLDCSQSETPANNTASAPAVSQGSACQPACQNNGECQQQFNSQSYACSCSGTGFTGLACSQLLQNEATPAPAPQPASCNGLPCVNGICLQQYNSQQYACQCSMGFSGAFCNSTSSIMQEPPIQASSAAQQPPPSSVCSAPCQNGGVCTQALNSQAYYCQCRSGFNGSDCSRAAGSPSVQAASAPAASHSGLSGELRLCDPHRHADLLWIPCL